MLLTITNRGKDAGDIGYLLHKNPARPQTFELSYGKAHVFYPVAEEEVCTAALLLDLNPVELVRDRKGKGEPAGLFDYVNDRPYVASSFLSTAISRVFGTALSGRCDKRPELVDMELDLTAAITMLPCHRGAEMVEGLFAPLGYKVKCEAFPLDERFPEWGDSHYFNVEISGKKRLTDLLGHLFVLIPALDSAKHYWVNAEEIEKLLRHGEGWLEGHPMKEYIAFRYLNKRRGLYNEALSRLAEEEEGEEEDAGGEGASGSGKSTFAKKHFLPTEVISSDFCRALVSDDENSLEATGPAFELVHEIARKRLSFGKLAAIDATNVQSDARKPLIALAKEQDCMPVAIVLDLPEAECQARNKSREDRQIPEHAIRNHARQLRSSLKHLRREGFRHIFILKGADEIDAAKIVRQPLWNDKKGLAGPFDIIGDIHGCFDELAGLLEKLGYAVSVADGASGDAAQAGRRYALSHPEGRIPVFLGDIGDRGPKIAECFSFVMDACESGAALCVCGNHDAKLLRKLNGRDVQATHGLDRTLAALAGEPPEFTARLKKFLDGLVSHYVFDGGRLVAAHAGLIEKYQGRSSSRVRDFCLYGDTSGETDEYGLPVRYDWAAGYRGNALVVYGHTPAPEAQQYGRTACVDTGCVFGGSLTAYRYPEGELVSVPSAAVYYEPARPAAADPDEGRAGHSGRDGGIPDIDDVLGKRALNTRLTHTITIREENAMAALETMSRFAADPRWLIYLPPTMSPCGTSAIDGLLEHPAEAFAYFAERGVSRVVCEQKHMGSRAIVIACRDEGAARARFGVSGDESGICYTRTGRRFFDDEALEAELIGRIREQLARTGFFDDFETDWACFDCELMPWSEKAQGLLKKQYAPTGVAGREGLGAAVAALASAAKRDYGEFDVNAITSGQNANLGALLENYTIRAEAMGRYIDAWREYCWPVDGLDGIRLAPFHLLATEGAVHADKDHVWHMETIARYAATGDGLVMATPYIAVDTADEGSVGAGVAWWEELTGRGGEGMVVKPFEFVARGARGIIQPAVKCRGPEYLRIIYGPEYLLPENLARLKKRSLGKKQSLALKEFSLGIEALERFCRREPFYRVHECVFGVLAMESEPVDPRL